MNAPVTKAEMKDEGLHFQSMPSIDWEQRGGSGNGLTTFVKSVRAGKNGKCVSTDKLSYTIEKVGCQQLEGQPVEHHLNSFN